MSSVKRARIQDIAKQCNVSMMTVSRVLNNDEKVSEKTRKLVLEAAKKLNYRPNVSARRLASSKSFFLGLLYDNPSTSYVSQFLLSALKNCRARGYHLIVDEADNNIENTVLAVKDLIDVTQVDGMILLPPMCNDPEILKILETANLPFVRISPDTQLNISPYICMDDYQAAFDVTEKLIQQGHTKIGHIIGHPEQGVSRLRYQGYLDALRSNQINIPPEYIEQGQFTYKSGLHSAKKILALKDRPSAIFAGNDDMAAATISAAHMCGIDVPSQLSVIGFDDTLLATSVWPQISTVKQPIEQMAKLAVELLTSGKLDGIDNNESNEYRHVLDFEIINRDSTAKVLL